MDEGEEMEVVGMEEELMEEEEEDLEEVVDLMVEVGVVDVYNREGEVGSHCGYLRDL